MKVFIQQNDLISHNEYSVVTAGITTTLTTTTTGTTIMAAEFYFELCEHL